MGFSDKVRSSADSGTGALHFRQPKDWFWARKTGSRVALPLTGLKQRATYVSGWGRGYPPCLDANIGNVATVCLWKVLLRRFAYCNNSKKGLTPAENQNWTLLEKGSSRENESGGACTE